MLAEERRWRIQELLARQSSVAIAELAETFGTSEMTIRRDLDDLQSRGICHRTHGGAISLRINTYPTTTNVGFPHYSQRQQSCAEEKTAIARRAASLVRPGDIIAIDSGTTASHLAHALRTTDPISVITNSIGVLAQLYDVTSVSLISPGGTLSIEGSLGPGGDMSFVGPVAVSTLRDFRPTKAFIGASGLSVADGVFNLGLLQAEIKRTLIEIAEEAILIADHTKFGQVAGFIVSDLRIFRKVVTDTQAPARDVEDLRAIGVEVTLVDPAPKADVLRPALCITGIFDDVRQRPDEQTMDTVVNR